jgi:hypothetical protein
MAPMPARTAVEFTFHRRIGDSYQYWNPLSCALQSLDTASPSVPATSKSKKEFTHQYTFRRLVNSIGKLVWIAKLEVSKGDIEDRFLPKELILKVFPNTIVPNPLPESNHTQEPISHPSLTPVSEPAAILASSADKSTKKKKSTRKSGTASSKSTKTSSGSPIGKEAGTERVHTPYETLWRFTGPGGISLNKTITNLRHQVLNDGGDRLYEFMDKHNWWPNGVEEMQDIDLMETFSNRFESGILRILLIPVEFVIDIKETVESRVGTPTVAWLTTIFNAICCAQTRIHEVNVSWDHHIDKALHNARYQHQKLVPSDHPSDIIDAPEFEKLITVLEEEVETRTRDKKSEVDTILGNTWYNIEDGWKSWCVSNALEPLPDPATNLIISESFGRQGRSKNSIFPASGPLGRRKRSVKADARPEYDDEEHFEEHFEGD